VTVRPARTRSLHSLLHTFLVVVAVLPPAALVVFLVGSLLLSGGQASATMDVKWDVVVPYPLFTVPAVVLLVLAAVSVVLAILVVLTARRGDEVGLRGLFGPLIAATLSSVILSGVAPDGGTRRGDVIWGDQLMAAPLSAAAVVIVIVGAVWVGRRRWAADA